MADASICSSFSSAFLGVWLLWLGESPSSTVALFFACAGFFGAVGVGLICAILRQLWIVPITETIWISTGDFDMYMPG